jgi:two-component system, NarL family, nitrate/nitrite response regulator NarL
MDGTGETRVLIVGEDPLARGGLAVLLAGAAGVLVVGQTAPGAQAVAAVTGLQPDAVLWDLGVSPREVPDGIGGVGGVGGVGSLPAVVVLVADEEVAVEALAAGARGVLPREAGPGRIAAALRAAARGLVVLDDDFAAALLRPRAPSVSALVEPLTSRELEVLQLLSEGLSNKEIGSRLGISESTAKFHVNAIAGKLGANGRTDAVVRAARLGLLVL